MAQMPDHGPLRAKADPSTSRASARSAQDDSQGDWWLATQANIGLEWGTRQCEYEKAGPSAPCAKSGRTPVGMTVNGMCLPNHGMFDGAAEPSDHLSAITNRIVTRSSGSTANMTGELGSLAAQLFVMLPGE